MTASIWLPCYSFCVIGGGFVAFRAVVYNGQYLATLLYSFCVIWAEDLLLFERPSMTASIWLLCYSFSVLGGGFVAFRAAVYDGQYLATLL